MVDTTGLSDNPEPHQNLPMLAPCRSLTLSAPWRWLKLGFIDLRRAPYESLAFGLFMSTLTMLVLWLAYRYGSAWIMLSMLCGFIFVAPLSCISIYAISAQLERNQPVSFRRALRASLKRYIGTELVFALVLLVVFLIWARASSMVSIFLPQLGDASFAAMWPYLLVLSLVAAFFLMITFWASAFSLPMIMHRDVDAITAVLTSINAVLRNKLVISWWGILILFGFVLGVISAGAFLVPFLPTVGHAVWHSYRETIDASAFPRHRQGITAIPRST